MGNEIFAIGLFIGEHCEEYSCEAMGHGGDRFGRSELGFKASKLIAQGRFAMVKSIGRYAQGQRQFGLMSGGAGGEDLASTDFILRGKSEPTAEVMNGFEPR